ncbi:hybrid sensor histidine kinase/response regulator [Burkholderia diffusa]|uniref:hybrid sensor histidine kinase/response regulator n=1 Tax=Burkholderia diffusa TaxID=488732 RepID=UPI00075EC264|nr:hybrid sensor histidine kinase/response regulator [Burkholderia diffusa]KVH48398.1 hypothetical protein WJ39_13885 [Burkholderia diffusa]
MSDRAQRGLPGRIRQNQNVLLYGGGIVITFVVVAAFVFDAAATVQITLRQLTQQWVLSMRRVEQANAGYDAYFRSMLLNIETAWNGGARASSETIDAFRAQGRSFILNGDSQSEPMLIVGHSDGPVPAELDRYIGVAERMASRLANIRSHSRNDLTNYLYSSEQKLAVLSLSKWPDPATLRSRLADRRRVLDAFASNRGGPLLPAGAPTVDPRTGRRILRWLPPFTDPLTGERAARVAAAVQDAEGRAIGVMVGELPFQLMLTGFSIEGLPGAFFVTTGEGEVMASTSMSPITPEIVAQLNVARPYDAVHQHERRYFSNGAVVFREQLNDTGWTLAYLLPWRSVAALLFPLIAMSGLMTLMIIFALWIVLLLFNRRMVKPALEQSQRVFDSEKLSRTLIETAPVGLGVISRANGTPLLRSASMDALAARVALDVHALSSRFIALRSNRPEGSVAHEELTLHAPDGVRIDLAVSMAPARYQGEPVVVTALSDVTANKQIEARLRDAKQAADAANAAKSAFLATMSHEIRTPLNAILGNLELLAHTSLSGRQQDRLNTIRRSSEGLLSIISDVLDFSKIEAGEMPLESLTFPVIDVIERALMIFGPVASAKGLRLYPAFGLDVDQTMRADPTRVGQVINNLLSNAIKFTERGEVMLRVDADGATLRIVLEDTGIGMTPQQRAVLFRPFAQGDGSIGRRFGGTGLGLALCQRLVSAMGGAIEAESEPGRGSRFIVRMPLGVPLREHAHRFAQAAGPVVFVSAEPAWKAFAVAQLTAWGFDVDAYRSPDAVPDAVLDTAHGLVIYGERECWTAESENRLFEAGTWVIDAKTEGPQRPLRVSRIIELTCFSLTGLRDALQIALTGKAGPAPEPERRHSVSQPLSVLVAEDNEVNRLLFEEQLALLGCNACVVNGGDAALAALEHRSWDVLLTDLNMPGMSGYVLAERARALRPGLPVVAVTAQATLDEHAKCKEAGMTAIVTKPLSLANLADVLEATVEGSRSVADSPSPAPVAAGDGGGWLGGRALPDDLLDAFRKSVDAFLATLAVARRDGKVDVVQAELHSLKGTLGVFRLTALAHRCAALETLVAEEGKVALGDERFDGFAADLRALESA